MMTRTLIFYNFYRPTTFIRTTLILGIQTTSKILATPQEEFAAPLIPLKKVFLIDIKNSCHHFYP